MKNEDVKVYTQIELGQHWLSRYQGHSPVLSCVLGFTETALLPGISAAGATPEARRFTALADAEFLYHGPLPQPQYPLPPLQAGASPVLISRAVVEMLSLPIYLFNAGLPEPPPVPTIDLGGEQARCLSQGCALELTTVKHLLEQGLVWGEKLAANISQSYLIVGECVVGGTTTALAILTGLGIAAKGKVSSSHPVCNHAQKWALVQMGLQCAGLKNFEDCSLFSPHLPLIPKGDPEFPISPCPPLLDPLRLVAAVGDPMQIVAAGIAIAASRTCGVMLAGGTQMLAVYALMQAITREYILPWQPEQVVVGTTRWVAEDTTGHTVELAQMVAGVPLLATQLSFAASRHTQLRAYEQGYVKEGMGAGGCCIAAHLTQGLDQAQLLQIIETMAERYSAISS
ncbi:MAG: nicotinate-nucleotide--dimethylbenzimidazole phosphoribosyltransferase [Chroococcidiopsidaceae cyanobacterium CP_BM_RX_35]|nr:nicotinate-nucleotide--dimethylbenzimidazole phosphoribosyltransferase [Chroococcidiopsidaceae cyanobacterium CP_BM_RX_35]